MDLKKYSRCYFIKVQVLNSASSFCRSDYSLSLNQETISGKAGGYVALKCGFDGVQWFKTDENGKLVAVKDLG